MASAMEATTSVRSLATDSYNAAAKRFITKDFEGSVEFLSPIINKSQQLVSSGQLSAATRTKAWLLYITLCDTAFSDNEEWSRESRRTLSSKIADGTFWKELQLAFDDSLAAVPPQVMLQTINAMVKHKGNPAAATKAAEQYLSHFDTNAFHEIAPSAQAAYRSLVLVFVRDLLPETGEFSYAKEFAANCSVLDAATKHTVSTQLDAKKEAAQDQLAEQLRTEEQRVNDAIAVSSVPEQGQSVPRSPAADQALQTHAQALTHRRKSSSLDPLRLPRGLHRPHSISEYWRHWLKGLGKQSIINLLLVVLLLMTAATNRHVRLRARQITTWLISSARQAITMGMTVTYF